MNPEDIAPGLGLVVVGRGSAPTGEQWAIHAGGTATDFYTILVLTLPDGRVQGGGCGGAVLAPGRAFEIGTGVNDDGPLYLVGRSHPAVSSVRIRLAEAGELVLEPTVGTTPTLDVRFFAAVLPRSAHILEVAAYDADGNRQDTTHGPFASAR